ncbi:hypothetical protein CRENBAI_004107, partial [Crenichthys baileyi]
MMGQEREGSSLRFCCVQTAKTKHPPIGWCKQPADLPLIRAENVVSSRRRRTEGEG